MFTHVGKNGIMSMYDITVISIIVAANYYSIKEYGGIADFTELHQKAVSAANSKVSWYVVLVLFVDICTANNTAAIVMAGPIAKDISEESATPAAALSAGYVLCSMGQGLIPYGTAFGCGKPHGTYPFAIIPYCFYPLLMGISGLIFIFIKNKD